MRLTLVVSAGLILLLLFGYQTALAPTNTSEVTLPEASVAVAVGAAPDPQEAPERYPVVKVVDGDTLVVAMGGENITLRLIGLDTPEVVDPRKPASARPEPASARQRPVQCFGREASEKAKHFLAGTSVSLETDTSQGALDKYGRTLAYVFLPDGTNFNKLMIEEGYGHEYTYNLPYTYQKEFKDAEQKARVAKKGLWADDACASESDRSSPPTPIPSQAVIHEGGHVCGRNAYNCSNFSTQAAAQSALDACGGSSNDIHILDVDGDGQACESLR